MKRIRYKILSSTGVCNPNTEKVEWEDCLVGIVCQYSEANEETAKREAYNGEYTIEDDGTEEIITPTSEERIEALEAAVSMLCMPDISEV